MAEALDPGHLFGHVKDAEYFEVPHVLGGKLDIPQPFGLTHAVHLPTPFEPFDLRITKFMVLEVVAAIIVAAIFIRLAGKMSGGERTRGRFWNLMEAMIMFIRDDVA